MHMYVCAQAPAMRAQKRCGSTPEHAGTLTRAYGGAQPVGSRQCTPHAPTGPVCGPPHPQPRLTKTAAAGVKAAAMTVLAEMAAGAAGVAEVRGRSSRQ